MDSAMREFRGATEIGSPMNWSITEQLEGRKKSLEEQLERVNNAIDLLKKFPDTQEVLDALSKLGVR